MRTGRESRAALVCAAVVAATAFAGAALGDDDGAAWTTYGDSPARLSAVPAETGPLARRFVLPLKGRITGQVLYGAGAFYVATTSGEVVSFTADGFVRWRTEVGQLAHTCQQLDGYGVVGTGVIDGAAGTLYLADAFGRLHALALGTGAERPGFPLRVFRDYRRALVWGALALVDGSVYVPTAAYCDAPSLGGVFRVELASGEVTRWIAVPGEQGGGGGPWGWGGLAYDAGEHALFAATSGAFEGGSNSGDDYTETEGYGDRLVQLSTDLIVQGSSHPADLPDRQDLDFVGSPLVIDRPGCGGLVVAATKNNVVYAWRLGNVSSGPTWEVALEQYEPGNPFLTQLAWHASLASLYAVTGTELVRIQVASDCSARIVWRKQLGTHTENGSPTIEGDTVWFAVNGPNVLAGHDARTGARVAEVPLGGTTLEAPTIVGHRLVVGTFTGLVEGFSFGAAKLPASASGPGAVAAESSWVDSRYGWQSRASGVYATDDSGRSWRRIYPAPALRVARLTRSSGVIDVGLDPGRCMCTTRKLWTDDGGKTWHQTTAVGNDFLASAGRLYWWQRGAMHVIEKLPSLTGRRTQASKPAVSVADGVIVDAASISDGVVALVSSRISGRNWDTAPRVLVLHGSEAATIDLPAVSGRPLAARIEASWPKLTVTATDYAPDPARRIVWSSSDGGVSWQAEG